MSCREEGPFMKDIHRIKNLAAVAVFVVAPLMLHGSPSTTAVRAQEARPAASAAPQVSAAEMRGDALVDQQNYEAAIEAYRQAPNDSAELWNKIGVAYHHLLAIDKAKADYEHALKLQPDFASALNNLGAVFYDMKEYRQAEKLYRRAIKSKPDLAVAYVNLGTAYFAEKKFKKGFQAYHAGFVIDPSAFRGNSMQAIPEQSSAGERAQQEYCLAELFARAGNADLAIEHLRKALNEGFNDRKFLMRDEELAGLRDTPQFAQFAADQGLR
jgi:tetratricopeptide (TPR) repeat protein